MYVLKSITEFKTYTAHIKYCMRLKLKGVCILKFIALV